MNVKDRFDGAAVWLTLSEEQKAGIGAMTLELLAAWYAIETTLDPHDPDQPLHRAAEGAEDLLIEGLRERLVEAVPRNLLEDIEGEPRLPSILGAVCRSCGCTDNNACFPACSWVEPDLCSACTQEPADA